MFGIRQNHMIAGLAAAAIFSVNLVVLIYRPQPYLQAPTNVTEPQTPRQTPPQEPTVPPQCGSGPIARHGQMVPVRGTKTLLVGAYREHRTRKREVRVLSVALRKEKAAYRCRFCCEDGVHVAKGVLYINYDHFGYPYSTADIMCPLPSGCETPSHVAVTSAAAGYEDKQKHKRSEVFLEMNNQGRKRGSFRFEFTTCISTMFEFTNVLQMVQELEMLLLMGVNRVVVYQTSNSPEVQRALDYYVHTGFVEVIPWSLPSFLKVSRGWIPANFPGDIHYHAQIPALNDCLYRYMYQSRYVAQHDIDELILPQTVNSWPEMMPLLKNKYGAHSCYIFQNFIFPITTSRPPPESQCRPPSSPDWQYVPGINILDHLYHEPLIRSTEYGNFKIIVNPRSVTSVSVHGVLKPPKVCVWVNRKMARMFHTRNPKQPALTSNKLIYDGRLLMFGDRLTKKVNGALRQCGLLPEESVQ